MTTNGSEVKEHIHPYVKIKRLGDEIPRLLQAAGAMQGNETGPFDMRYRVKVWESDVPNRVEAKLLFTKSVADDSGTLAWRLFGVARATTDLWDILCAFRSHLGDPIHFELVSREVMTSDHPFRYEDDWFGFQVWWVIDEEFGAKL